MFRVEDVPLELFTGWMSYKTAGNGCFSTKSMQVDTQRQFAAKAGTVPNPVDCWQFTDRVNEPIYQLSLRLLSVVANTASLERAFSSFKLIKTAQRNRLGVDKLHNLAFINIHIRAEDQKLVSSKKRKRQSTVVAVEPAEKSAAIRNQIAPPTLADLFNEDVDFEQVAETLLRQLRQDAEEREQFQGTTIASNVCTLADLFGSNIVIAPDTWDTSVLRMNDEMAFLEALQDDVEEEPFVVDLESPPDTP